MHIRYNILTTTSHCKCRNKWWAVQAKMLLPKDFNSIPMTANSSPPSPSLLVSHVLGAWYAPHPPNTEQLCFCNEVSLFTIHSTRLNNHTRRWVKYYIFLSLRIYHLIYMYLIFYLGTPCWSTQTCISGAWFGLVSFDQIFTARNMAKPQTSWLHLQAIKTKSTNHLPASY